MDPDVALTLANNGLSPESLVPAYVASDSVIGALVELGIFFAARSPFYEQIAHPEGVSFYYVMKWFFEEAALFLSWEFWERPGYRTIMLRQLTVRNILFQLRYLPNFDESPLKKVYLLQPVVVLTLAIIHIITERIVAFNRQAKGDIRTLVSGLFNQVGVHLYISLLMCEYFANDPNAYENLWIRTCLLTLVFQSGMLMFAVFFFTMLFADVILIARLFDLVAICKVMSLVSDRIQAKSGFRVHFSLDAFRFKVQDFLGKESTEIAASMQVYLTDLHPLLQMLASSCTAIFAWTGSLTMLMLALVVFSSALALVETHRAVKQRPTASIYFLNVCLCVVAITLYEVPGFEKVLTTVRMLLGVAGLFSHAGVRDLVVLAMI